MFSRLKFFAVPIIIAAVVSVMNVDVASAKSDVITWDMPMTWPATNYQSECAQRFADEVKTATNGKVEIVLHTGGSLGYKGPEMLSVVRDGLVPIASMLKGWQTGEERFFGIESLPFLAPGVTDLRMLQLFTRPMDNRLAKKHNQKILYQIPWPSHNVYTKKEIKTLEDLKGVKIRTVSKEDSKFFEGLGATSIQMPWGDVVPSLATGVIDGVGTSNASGVDGKFWEFLKYANKFDWQCSCDMVTVNLDAWNSLTPELQEIIETKAHELEPQFWNYAVEVNRQKEKILADNGMTLTSPNPELRKQIIKATLPIWKDFTDNVDGAKPIVEGYLQLMGIDFED